MVASPRPGNREQNPKSWGRSWAPDLVGINSVRPLQEQVPGFSASLLAFPSAQPIGHSAGVSVLPFVRGLNG